MPCEFPNVLLMDCYGTDVIPLFGFLEVAQNGSWEQWLSCFSMFWRSWKTTSLQYYSMMKFFKMIQDSREKEDAQIKQEEVTIDFSKHQMSKRLCSSFPNQRIIRLSQADHFGGKDRHSKVSTIKGLRDRRVRLSIPTAIQVYDLQDKLGLNQPSKVVDWLINAAQNEIDRLPSVQLLPTGSSFLHFPQTDAINMDEQSFNSSSSSIRSRAFGCVNADPLMLISNSYVDDITSFPTSTFNSYHQMEPYDSHVGYGNKPSASSSSSSHAPAPAETQLVMPSLFSPYLAGTDGFQTPSTMAELLPWNSSSINSKQYDHQEAAARQLENVTVYMDSGAGYGVSAADFF